jgi:photosystem II protein
VLRVEASGNKKINVKEPFGPGGGAKFKGGLDASGRKMTGKGVYQFSKKYGANVDGYSPIYTPAEWAVGGDVYTGGQAGLTLWALTFGALLLVGAFLVYSTSALA